MMGVFRKMFAGVSRSSLGRTGRGHEAAEVITLPGAPGCRVTPPSPLPTATPAVQRPDPWRDRWVLYEAMLRDLDAALGPRPPAPTRRLLFFSTMPWWTDFSLATAVVLAGRGCHVDFAWTPYPDVDDRPATDDEWAALVASGPAVHHPRLRVVNLLQVTEGEPTPEQRREAEQAAFIDAQYVTGREEIDLSAGSRARAVYEFRLARNLRTMTALASLVEGGSYDRMVTPNGWVLEFGAAYRLARLVGLPCSTLEVHDRKYRIHAGQTLPVLFQDTDVAWRADAPHAYTADRDERVRRILSGRAGGDWAEYVLKCQSVPPVPAEELMGQLQLEPAKKVAILCANVAHDSVVLGRNRTFTSMGDWVRRTIDLFARHPDWQLVVRAHPAELVMPPDESAESIVRRHCPGGLPTNVRLVLPGDPVNTYALMSLAHVGLVYNSTAGLEMACNGLPVVAAGLAHYGGKGFTADPDTPAEYAAAVAAALAGPPRMSQRQTELARCYLDLYFNALPFPYPWVVGNLDDFRTWPVRRVLCAEGDVQFGRTFDFLAGSSVPITDRVAAVG